MGLCGRMCSYRGRVLGAGVEGDRGRSGLRSLGGLSVRSLDV